MMKIMLYFHFQNTLKINKNLNFAQFSGADWYILFCGPMFVPALILTLLDPRGYIQPLLCFFVNSSPTENPDASETL